MWSIGRRRTVKCKREVEGGEKGKRGTGREGGGEREGEREGCNNVE